MRTMKSGESLLDEWRSMQRRIVDHLREPRSSDLADAPMRLPGSVYTDPLRFEAERRKVFTEQPLLVGLSGDLPEPGDRMVVGCNGYFGGRLSEMASRYGAEVEVVSGARASFEIIADGETLFSKLATGRFPDDAEVSSLLD